ncbi:membrane protein insertase YidC [Marilutibacter chinensis]|uniref:Membrane protein insertase YidC n=1 Tax=Marilutibacter chinensis TaxID=2912247 RepID=A0ABS9HXS4_9GAMM|nr:membrane protein insertase YidC [Lysobacter chinensis]MCF7223675.1 membrane protein insertase YidC [Lysobacter chinensis]
MNQTRLFLIFAWLMVATLLWVEWNEEQAPAPQPAATAVPGAASVPGAGDAPTASVDGIPSASSQAPANAVATAPTGDPSVTVSTDVFRVELGGGELSQVDLIGYGQTAAEDSPPVRLFTRDPLHYFVARSGWSSPQGAPDHARGFRLEGDVRSFALAEGQDQLVVPFLWTGADGVTIRRSYTFRRGDYAIGVRDEVVNNGDQPWQGYIYRELDRIPAVVQKSGPMSAESYSFQGAVWYDESDGYDRRNYDDFVDDGPLNRTVNGGWIAMLQHHFFAAWIPQQDQASLFVLEQGNGRYGIESRGPSFNVAPGGSAATTARLWVGPKLVEGIKAQEVKGLDRAVDYSRFDIFAALANALFWLLEKIHVLVGNWGWAIIGLVVIIKAIMYPLSKAQYKSMARMRKFQPRIAALKERYGEDRQKFQQAMMELYKKEKINPVGGCLPMLVQMPVFLALYWVLLESVELRHAPWMLWIQDLTARDPYFVLPAINMAVMWATQKLTPMTGMDPMQQKMMQFMPLVFGVMFAFFPAGLVLYWVTNGALGLLQQWWMTKKYAEAPVKG